MRPLVLAFACLAACSPVPMPDTSLPPRPDLGNATDAASGCTSLGVIDATDQQFQTSVESGVTANRIWQLHQSSVVGAQAYGTPSSLVGVVADLATGANANYRTCTHCLLLYLGCDSTGHHCASRPFFQRSGRAAIDSFNTTGSSTPFGGVFLDADLEEVSIDPATDQSTPVAGGACYHVERLTFGLAVGGPGIPGSLTSSSGNSTGYCGSCPTTCASWSDCNGGFCMNGKCVSNIACPHGAGTYCGASVGYDPRAVLSCTPNGAGGSWTSSDYCAGTCDTLSPTTAACHLRVASP